MRGVTLQLPKVYPITDTRIAGIPVEEQVCRLIAGGSTFIQVREKTASSREFYEAAVSAVRIAHGHGARIIINDRVDIAMLAGADGVHLGQEDLPPAEARKLLGEKAVIGFSTHSIEQIEAAVKMPIDYVAFGPIFPTATKERPDPVVGLELLRAAKRAAGGFPLVAIGGIDNVNFHGVIDAGADSAAMISSILSNPDKIEETVRLLLSESDLRRKNSVATD